MRLHGLWLAALAALAISSACGRTGLNERCSRDGDCGDGFFCSDGFCVVEGVNNSNNGTNNVTNNTANNAACVETPEGLCVFDVLCDSGDCEPMLCDVGCPPDSVQVGCDCEQITCGSDAECPDGLLCLGGICDGCKEDTQCPDGQVCSADSRCVEDSACRDDSECQPDERCAPDGLCRPRPDCVFDADCPRDQLCLSGRCTVAPDCQVDLDCPQGQECVGGNCFVALCRGPEDCATGEICDAGECVVPQEVGSCEVATQDQLIVDGQRIPLEAFAFDANGRAIAANFQWTSSNTGVARVIPGPSAQGGASAGSADLTATTGNIACTGEATLTNPGPVMMNSVRVVVTDMENGGPLAGATVRLGNTSVTTDMAGVAMLADPGMAFEVSVFHDDYNWLTLQGVSSTDIRIPLLRRGGTGPVAGFTGEFDTSLLHSSGNITLGLAGGSLAGGLLELGLGRLLGDIFVSRLEIPGVVDTDIPLPGGIIAYGGAFGFQADIKRTYYAQAAGGPRIAWGLAGLLPFAELLDFFQGGGFEGTSVIAQLLPLFNRFDHGSYPRTMTELPRVVDGMDLDRDGDTSERLPDYLNFPEIDLAPSVRQNLVTDVNISNFPILDGAVSEVAILVGGVVLPSPGFVPMGISATADENGDGRPDLRRLSIAPSYGSLTGGRYAIVALTFNGGGGGGMGPGGFALPDEFSVALWSGQSYPTSVSLGTFPDASQAFVTNASRSVSVSSTAGPMHRVRMVGPDRSWDVWAVGPPGVMGQFGNQITVPAAPMGGPDLFATGRIFVDAIQTNVNVDDLVSSSGIGLKNAGLVTSAYNRTLVR